MQVIDPLLNIGYFFHDNLNYAKFFKISTKAGVMKYTPRERGIQLAKHFTRYKIC